MQLELCHYGFKHSVPFRSFSPCCRTGSRHEHELGEGRWGEGASRGAASPDHFRCPRMIWCWWYELKKWLFKQLRYTTYHWNTGIIYIYILYNLYMTICSPILCVHLQFFATQWPHTFLIKIGEVRGGYRGSNHFLNVAGDGATV